MCSTFPTRHSIFCILPPHILRQMARRGSERQRNAALDALAVDTTLRTSRLTRQMMMRAAAIRLPVPTLGPVQKQRRIYDAQQGSGLPGAMARAEGQDPVGDPAVNEAYDSLGTTFDFYSQVFQRNSIDNAGLSLDASVHYGTGYDNAFWNGQQMVFGDGDGQLFSRFTISVDVIGHELTHGVTGSEANLLYTGESGALNESISDVFGSLVRQYKLQQSVAQADWLIGLGLFTSAVQSDNPPAALRSLKAPGTAYNDPVIGQDPQPDHMSKYVFTNEDNGGVHINSGIPNKSFYLVATNLGGNAWEKAGAIWYDTLRDQQLSQNATFADFASRTSVNAGHRFGSGSAERQAVVDAWQQVGVKVT